MEHALQFGEMSRIPDIRKLVDMQEVIYDSEWLCSAKDCKLYYMYRELAKTASDLKLMQAARLRYDITIIPPAKLGKEFVKTKGHYHPKATGAEVSYPELYQVLEGKATYLLQKADKEKLLDVLVIEAKKGDIVLIPPDYGHISINASQKILKMANWVSTEFSSLYEPIRRFKGGAYYLLEAGFVKNSNYSETPKIRRLSPTNPSKLGLSKGENIYELVKELEKLRFLKKPQEFKALFAELIQP
ncbi:MAG: glucose-6-phosphate isomerase family protein [Methanosarcinaceae archaeon]|nr:glucose-6-phosphate isomerase family protein [Methanosarcinaceae archaeon]